MAQKGPLPVWHLVSAALRQVAMQLPATHCAVCARPRAPRRVRHAPQCAFWTRGRSRLQVRIRVGPCTDPGSGRITRCAVQAPMGRALCPAVVAQRRDASVRGMHAARQCQGWVSQAGAGGRAGCRPCAAPSAHGIRMLLSRGWQQRSQGSGPRAGTLQSAPGAALAQRLARQLRRLFDRGETGRRGRAPARWAG